MGCCLSRVRSGTTEVELASSTAPAEVAVSAPAHAMDSVVRALAGGKDSTRTVDAASGASGLLRKRLKSGPLRRRTLTRQQLSDRLAVPRAIMKWQQAEHTMFDRDEIQIDRKGGTRALVLDQLVFS